MDNIWKIKLRQRKQFKCDKCDLKFINKFKMLLHRDSPHKKKRLYSKRDNSAADLYLECDRCKRKFNKKYVLRNHVVHCFNLTRIQRHLYECSKCHLQFRNKRNMRRHEKMLHKTKRTYSKGNNAKNVQFECHNCARKFNRKDGLKYHILRCSNVENFPIRLVKCVECNLKFTSRSNMMRHQNSLHGNRVLYANGEYVTKSNFQCDNCKRNFNRKDVLKNHVVSCYNLDVHRSRRQFECDVCQKSFTCKSNMMRHKKIQHEMKLLNSNENYQCDTCKVTFSRKDSLIRHLENCFTRKKRLKCEACNLEFENKTSRRKHEISQHSEIKKRHLMRGGFKCVMCSSSFPSTKSICNHILMQHDIQLDHEHLYFATTTDFFKWKRKLEESTTTSYRKRHFKKTKRYTVCRFTCHRSGSYTPKTIDRQRQMKFYGSKKVGGYCPGEICVRIDSGNGSCKVSFVKTHIGHNISNKEIEIRHIYVHKQDLGVGFSKLESNDTMLVGNDDSKSNNFNLDALCHLNYINTETFVSQHSGSIIYYKKDNELDDRYPSLLKDDVIIIIMTDLQKELLKKYGQNMVMIDDTYDPDKYNVLMLTLLVVDGDNEGVEVAFALSNRNDELLAAIFFECLKEAVGTVKTRTLMSDIQESYYTTWKDIMGKPQFWLFCSWHVREAWQQNLKKIRNYEKRNRVRNELYCIASRFDESVFLSELSDLLEDKDPELTEFLTYFSTYFINNVKSWAYCYRKSANVNTNMCAEAFHSMLKRFRKKNPIDFDVCLQKLNKFLTVKERTNRRKKIRTKIANKLKILQQNHKSMENKVMEIYGSDTDGWYISLSVDEYDKKIGRNEATINFISKAESNCQQCRLYCKKCKICAHRYECSCMHSSMTYHMCIHIHALCIFLQYNSNTETQSNGEELITFTSLEDIPKEPLGEITLESPAPVETKTEPSNVSLKEIKEMILQKVVSTLNEVKNEEEGFIIQKYVESWDTDLKTRRRTSKIQKMDIVDD